MGYSMRTTGWRYTAWLPFKCDVMAPMKDCASAAAATPDWARARTVGVELYDHRGDASDDFATYENVNVATQHPDVVAAMHAQLVAKWAKPMQEREAAVDAMVELVE